MSASRYKGFNLDALPALAFLLFGLVMAYGSLTMPASFSGTNEHRWVPLGMSLFVCLLSAVLLLQQIASSTGGNAGDTTSIKARNLFLLALPCIVLLAAYAQAHIWFGYPAATFVSGVLVFRLFRNSWLSSLLQSSVATLVLYIVFFKLLKLYNPPGRLLDLALPF